MRNASSAEGRGSRSWASSGADDLKIIIDGRCTESEASTVDDLLKSRLEGTIALVNGRHAPETCKLKDGDSVFFLDGGREFVAMMSDALLSERYTRDVFDRLHSAKVGIAGLGGIGSHIAEALARSGIGHLVTVDFDVVDQTNLDRQNYFADDIGKPKSVATRDILLRIRPCLDLRSVRARLTRENCREIFSGCDVVCEAFDDPESKSMLVESLLCAEDGPTVVSCSGMSGFGSSNSIVTARRMDRLYVCGDGESDADADEGLVASRVMVCAGHAANMAIRIVLGRRDP